MESNNTQFPAEVVKKIDQDAEYVAALHFHPHYSQDANTACRICYRTGAKEYAQWYVKSTALESELHGVRAENERLKKSMIHLMDVFKIITKIPVPATEKEYMSWFVYIKNVAGGVLSEQDAMGFVKELSDRSSRIETALKQFISYHETGLLPDRGTYEKGVEAMKGEVEK
jgi:hypothetical protein